MAQSELPRRVGRYQLLELIGSGTMGSVYLAAHETLKRQRFAVKTLRSALAGDEAFVARFRREAELAARLSHPNLVSVVDFGTGDGGTPFLVMKHVPGPSLREVIARDAPLSPTRAGSIARQLALALAHVHERGLVHRDVKPSNVIIASEDGREVPRLLDFGMVGALDDEAVSRLTAAGMTLGTPLYIAPEQVHDSQVGASADLYALGVTLHEMLTGSPPFTGSAEAIMAAKVRNDVVRPENGNALELLAWGLLAPHPDDRIQTARDVVVAIDAALAGDVAGVFPRAKKQVRRPRLGRAWGRRVIISATLSGAAVLGGAAAWFAGRPR